MLLHELDVPYVMPHTMAFVVDRARLSQFRQALRAVLEDGQAGPMRQFCDSRRIAYTRERNRARVTWARDLRFRIAEGRELPNVIDPVDDLVPSPDLGKGLLEAQECWSPGALVFYIGAFFGLGGALFCGVWWVSSKTLY